MAKILVVDDDVNLSKVVHEWLTYQEKHCVQVANKSEEGWQLIQSDEFDLIVLDWDMPGLTGMTILQRFREGGGTTPIIMLTGHAQIDDKELAFDVGANDYLTKPFHLKELASRVRVMIKNVGAQAAPPKPLGTDNAAVLQRADLAGSELAARYEFLSVLGEGAGGIVFKARHPLLDKLVAIKILPSSELKESAVARFETEGRAVSRLEHPNIVIVHDFGITKGRQPYMVMEFIEGKALDAIVKEEELLSVERAIEIMLPICDGLSYAHDVGVLHRDITPSNIMLKQIIGRQPVPKILDFGLAQIRQAGVQAPGSATPSRTAYGSPPYMSPEQVRGLPLDDRSEVYSFGCVLFQVVTGYPPHLGTSAQEIMSKHLSEPPLTFRLVRPELTYPEELEPLIAKALAKKPDQRYENMGELKDALESMRTKLRQTAGGLQ